MKPWLKLGSVVATLALLAACSSGIEQPDLELDETPELSTQGTSVSNVVPNSASDAEENAAGEAYTTSTVLELGYKVDGTPQTTGIRFSDVAVPKGARVTSAFIRFSADTDKSEVTNLSIAGQDAASGGPFSSIANDITSRTKTSARSSWQPESWVDGQRYNSSSIVGIVQEVVNRSDWQPGAAMVFIISGSGTRKAVSYDQNSTLAPKLYVTYEAPPPSRAFKPDLRMTVNPNFSVAALQSYDAANGTDAAIWYNRIVNSPHFSKTYTEFTTNSQGPLKVIGREINEDVSVLLLAFRMTGSEKILDRIYTIMDKTFTASYFETTSNGYRRWKYTGYPDSALEDTLAHGMVAQVAYAFYLNRGYKSSYASMYTKIKGYLRNDFEKIHEGSGGYNGGSITDKTLFHAYTNFTRYYWYMHLMLKNSSNADEAADAIAYKAEADRKGDVILRMMKTDPSNGTYVYSHRVWAEAWDSGGECSRTGGYKCDYHMNQYPQETATGFNQLIMDDFKKFSNNAFAQKLSRSYRLNVFNGSSFGGDRNDRVMSSDVGRNSTTPCNETSSTQDGVRVYHCYAVTTTFSERDPHVSGNPSITLQYKSSRTSQKMEVRHATEKNLAQMGIWDTTGEIMAKVETYYNRTQPSLFNAPASLLAYKLYKAGGFSLD